MKKTHIPSLLLSAALLLPSLPFAQAAEAEGWLIPRTVDTPPAFTDAAGTIAEDAARICFQAGLMTGVDDTHFSPAAPLSNAQIVVITARLHRLLATGSLGDFDSYRLPQDEWWHPYDNYLEEQLPALAATQSYANTCDNPTGVCYRYNFFKMLAAVLADTDTALPKRNEVNAVPDCQDPDIIQFYQAGILGGKDVYGTLDERGPLTRGAAAAMLGRLIDPSLRLTLELETLDLCKELLDLAPETPLMEVDGKTVTAEQFAVPYAENLLYYSGHFAGMTLELNGGWEGGETAKEIAQFIQSEALAEAMGIPAPASSEHYLDGYMGLTAAGQEWYARYKSLRAAVWDALGEESFPDLPEITYTEHWNQDQMQSLSYKIRKLPGWSNGYTP